MKLSSLLLAAAPLFGTALDFTGNICSNASDGSGAFATCPNGAAINQAYGDTAFVNFTYAVSNSSFGPFTLQLWGDAGVYSNLPKAAYGFAFSDTGTITMESLGGALVTLESFALGTSPPTFTRTATVTVVDLATNLIVFSSGPSSVGGAAATAFAPNVSSLVGLRLTVTGDLFNTGIGNFNFTAAPDTSGPSPVPEPTMFAALAAALAATAAAKLRR